jgi:hypothetical protein
MEDGPVDDRAIFFSLLHRLESAVATGYINRRSEDRP